MEEALDSFETEGLIGDVEYGGFWIRTAAGILDSLIFLPLIGLNFYNILVLKSLPLALVMIVIMAIYKPYMEFYYQATLGKMA